MAKRKHTAYLRHLAAMYMILSMQDEDNSVPNVQFVVDNEVAPRVPESPDYTMFRYLRDMFYLVDPAVYAAVRQMLLNNTTVGALEVSFSTFEQGMKFYAASVQTITDLAEIPLWTDGPPHPCYWIMREVVSDLLA